ncbi:hypothetical protein ACTA71_008607 [Dictyostelium dimigraforme]
MRATIMKYLPALAGIIFTAGWFLWIDGHVYENTNNNNDPDFDGPHIQWVYYLPGIFATLGMVMANIVDLSALNSNSLLFDGGSTKVRVWLFVSFAISFGCIGAALWIMIAVFLPPHNTNDAAQWPGVAITLQTSLIFLSSLILVYKKVRQDDGYDQF